MNPLIETLQEEFTANAETSFTISDLESQSTIDSEARYAVHSDGSDDMTQYTDRSLSEDMVATMDNWLENSYLHGINDDLVTHHLDETLCLLIAVRDGACGKELIQDLYRLFGTEASVGTVYPHLNDLADEGILEVTELPKRKVYEVAEPDTAFRTVEDTVEEMFAFIVVLKALLRDRKRRRSSSLGR